ncbi:DUF3857 domain-containing protein [Salegentibacter maritimus]|uniref:DUF3857 domain-containing protein n=1 Tax=Salegentibacter maritimus TaxID=2794347 RepID=A0ABS0TJC7_9FLAO|nr:DUF3857 domain-containing protein [Salegentibacter maritimus]MBI6121168.1 DUF3857 domain-containing protein [Salegentibacter maritimus]
MRLKVLRYLIIFWFITGLPQTSFGQVINNQTKIYISKNGKKTTKKTILVQVNNKEENWLSHIEMRHNPQQEFSFNYAYLTDVEGERIKKLKKKELTTRNKLSYQAFYQDDLITEFDLYWNQYPYRVEYSYTIEEEEFLYLAWWTPFLYSNVPTLKSSLEINLPANFGFQVESSKNTEFHESEFDNRKILSWKSSALKIPKEEIYSPAREKIIPIVRVIPHHFKYGVEGISSSWSSFGNWLDKLNDGLDELTFSEERKIIKIIDGVSSKKEVIKKLYYHMQDHTKYINVAIDVGGLKSYPASYVCENKYGDCKALTTYMKAMLKSMGIKSLNTIIKAGSSEAEININFPSQQFNHVILMVPLEKDTIWLENTSSALPFNYLGTLTQNRYALAVDGEKSRLIKTPKLLPPDVLRERNYNFQLSKNSETKMELDLKVRGEEFETLRYLISEKEEKLLDKEILKLTGARNIQIRDWSTVDLERDSSFVHIKTFGKSASVIREIGSYKVINPLRIKLPDFEKPSKRELDVVINLPVNRSDKSLYAFELLEAERIQIPEDISIESKYGLYNTHYSKEKNKVIVEENFTLLSSKIPVEEYGDFYRFLQSIVNHKKNSAILIK